MARDRLAGGGDVPAHGLYAYETHLDFMDSTLVLVFDANEGSYLYASVFGPDYACPAPSDEVPACYDAVLVTGTGR